MARPLLFKKLTLKKHDLIDMFTFFKWVSESLKKKKKKTHIKDLEAVSQLCSTIKVQSTGPQVEVSMDSVQGQAHKHIYTYPGFFFLKGIWHVFRKKCWRQSLVEVTSGAVACGESYKNRAKSVWVHLQGLQSHYSSSSFCLPSSYDPKHCPHLGHSGWALLLSLAYHRNTQKVNTHRSVTKSFTDLRNIMGMVGFASVWQLMLCNA